MATAVEIANAYIALTVKAPGVQKSIRSALGDASAAGDWAGRSIGSRLTSALSKTMKVGVAAVGAGVAAGIGTAFVKGFQRLNQIDTAQAKLKGLGNGAEAVSTIMSNALASVKGTAFGLGDAATTAAQLVAAQIQPGKQLESVLKSTANAAAASGSELSEMGSIYAKVASVGKAQNDVLYQVADRGIPIFQALGDQMGVTAEEVFKLASEGKIGFEQFESAMTAAAGTVADELGNTVGGSWANFIASLGRIGAGVMSGIFPQIAPAIQTVTAALEPLEDAAALAGEKIGQVLAPAFQWLSDALTGGIDFSGIAQIAGYFTPLGAVFQILQPILPAVQAAFASISDTVGGALAAVLPVIVPAVTDLVIALADLASNVVPALLPVVTDLVTQFAGFAQQVLPILVPAIVGLVSAGADLLAGFLPVIGAIAPALGPIAAAVLVTVGAWKSWQAIQKLWLGTQALVKGAQATMVAITYGQVGATYAATGAQKALNVAMKANPIGIIITAITALVGALVWFFTQTETGKKVWAEFTRFLGEAWTNISGFFTAAWENVIQPVIGWIGDRLTWLNENVVQPFVAGFKIGWEAVGAVAQWLWDSILQPVFSWIGDQIQVLGAVIKLIVDLIVNYFRFWAAIGVWLWENALQPVFAKIGEVFTWIWQSIIKPIVDLIVAYVRVWGAIFTWLWANVIQPVFGWIGSIFTWLWTNVISPVIGWISDKLNLLGLAFRIAYESYIKPAWESVGTVLSTVWTWINDHVFTPFKNGITAIQDSFKLGVEAIKTTWAGIKRAAADPINFVLGTVWNDGLRSFWNDVVSELGLDDMKLARAPEIAFASGGVMPGYTPGRDVHDFFSPTAGRLRLSGGEAIMRPEFTRAMGGAAGIDRLNTLARSGQLPQGAFADGGVWGWAGDVWNNVSNFAGDVLDNVKNAAKVAWDFVSDPIGSVKTRIIDGVIKPLLGDGGNTFLQTVGQLPLNLAGALGEKMKDWFTTNPVSAGKAGEPMGWQSLWGAVQAAVPGAVMTSNYRPGAVTVNGGQSYHSLGRAIDVIPATMETFNRILSLFPNASELIYSPAGNRQLLNGQPHFWGGAVRAQHWDHVHLAMANGGVMPQLYDQGGWLPHGGLAVNKSGKPEAVLDPSESAALKQGLGARHITIENVRGATVDEIADQITWAERRLARGGKYTGRIVI